LRLQRWVERYNEGGSAALAEGKRSGRPRGSRPSRSRRSVSGSSSAPRSDDGGTCVLHGKDIQLILEKEFKVMLKLSAVYELLHRLNLSYLRPRPRPRHPQAADAAAQEAL
jgi:transposase